jgi:hypothetical protein
VVAVAVAVPVAVAVAVVVAVAVAVAVVVAVAVAVVVVVAVAVAVAVAVPVAVAPGSPVLNGSPVRRPTFTWQGACVDRGRGSDYTRPPLPKGEGARSLSTEGRWTSTRPGCA